MRTPRFVYCVVIALIFSAVPAAAAPKRFSYDPISARNYALGNVHTPYGSRAGQNPFSNFSNNCANFVSQAIMGGMIMKTSPRAVYDRRWDFMADAGASLAWYFADTKSRGPAWTGARELYNYARDNKSSYRGLHFKFIGSDTISKRSLDPFSLQPGDVIFVDWDGGNTTINHVMMVTQIDFSLIVWHKYNRIKVTYQSNNTLNKGLQEVLDKNFKDTKQWATFYVYRPTDYNQAGR